MNLVLVHGFLDHGTIMRGIAGHLASAGHSCLVPSLKPSDARHGIGPLAESLGRTIAENLPPDARFALIGFSMGSLVCRHYLQELGGISRAEAFFSIAGPHAGTLTAYLYPGLGTRQMRPGSSYLAGLDQTTGALGDLPVVCYWSPMDLMILPHSSARWPRGELVRVWAPVHTMLLFNRRLQRDIAQRLESLPSHPRERQVPAP
jgi:triacylglycerol lipase